VSHPIFVVVGHPNQGKSSIVSTLLADDSVEIGSDPGTTIKSKTFFLELDEEVIYSVIDTPGFEAPRHLFKWLKERTFKTEERPQAVRDFVEMYRDAEPGGQYYEEVQLLSPIIQDGIILYVVDSNRDVDKEGPPFEAEMEILQWTGRTRIALINAIPKSADASDYTERWQTKLGQYFQAIKVFNAQQARFADRIELMETLSKLNDVGRPGIEKAIEKLKVVRKDNLEQSASAIATMISKSITKKTSQKLLPGADEKTKEKLKEKLQKKLEKALRKLETKCHTELRNIFGHRSASLETPDSPVIAQDLFNISTWLVFGLGKWNFLSASTAAGAAAGLVIDFMFGGVAGGGPTVLGGAIGFFGGMLSWSTVHYFDFSVERGTCGPIKNIRFPFVLLGRALAVFLAVESRAHALRDDVELKVEAGKNIVDAWPKKTRSDFSKLLGKIQIAGADSDYASQLQNLILKQLRQLAEGETEQPVSDEDES
jgi:GTPase SAR1 family protein